jgi:drug/metabolite transporter (DMT)-like permease
MNVKVILGGLAFALMWSSAFATARIIVASAPPLLSLSLRFFLSGTVAILNARALGQSWRLPGGWQGPQARAVLIFGLCQNALYLGLNFVAMQWIEASLAAIIASSMPLIVAALGWAWRGERTSPLGVFGLIVGMAGVALIMGTRVSGGADPAGIALCLIGATALAVATLSVRGASGSGNLLMIVGLQMLVGSVTLGVVSALTETPALTPSLPLLLAFLYQTFVPGLAATLIWFWLVGQIGAVRAATFHFLNPFFGVAIAALLLGERIEALDIVGVAVVMLGILAVQISKAQVKAP